MTRRVFIVHGFEGNPHGNWFDWLAAQARACGVQAGALAMPNPGNPTVQSWQFTLDQHIGKPDENAFLVGHSLGCITLLHFLCRQQPERIGGLVLAAGVAQPRAPPPRPPRSIHEGHLAVSPCSNASVCPSNASCPTTTATSRPH